MKVNFRHKSTQAALRTCLFYAAFAAVWILCSDKLLVSLISDPQMIGKLSIYKGLAFVTVTAFLLYAALRAEFRRWEREAAERRQVEQELRWRTAFFEAQVHSAIDGILVVDSQGRKILQNQRMTDLWKIPRSIADDPDDSKQIQFNLSRVKNPRSFAAKIAHLYAHPDEIGADEIELLDGTILDRYSAPVRGSDGAYYGRVWTFRDITGRKRTEQALQQSEERFLQMAKTIGEVFWLSPPDFQTILYISPAFEQVWGRPCSELHTHPMLWLETIHPEDAPRVLRALEELAQGKSYDIEFRILRPDVTERKRTEESHLRLATAVEQSTEAILITDTDGIILYANPALEAITGYSQQEVIGQNPRILKSGKHDTAFYQQMWTMLSNGKAWSGRLTNKRKDGTLFQEEATISPIRDSNGRITNYVAVKRDVTREISLEAQFRQSQKMDAFGQLAGGVAHDFNNLLTVIHGYASMLLNAQLKPAEQTDCIHQTIRAAERASSLTRQLLLFSRKQAMQPVNLDLTEVVRGMTKMLMRILGEHIELHTDFTPDLPLMLGDAGMIEQVLLNLAVNSRDAMPGGGRLTMSTGTEMLDEKQALPDPDSRSGLHVWLAVSDTGGGIAPEHLPRIFEPFFTTKEAGKGTGLGLATVYGIVQQHHGRITVDSEAGKGTKFRIFFPAAAGAKAKGKASSAMLQLPGGKETILVVEDDLLVRLLTINVLQRCGYNILQADSGQAAIKVWREHQQQIQLVLTDMVMPGGMSGRDLAEQLGREVGGPKVIYTSGYTQEFTKKELSLVEGRNFLQKPYSPLKLAQTVRDALDRQ